MKNIDAFIDESGNHDLDTGKSGASTHFIVVAVVLDRDQTNVISKQIEEIRAKHFQKGEMKSSSVRDKDEQRRRIKILNDILKVDFKFYAIAVNKELIQKDSGLQYKKSFLKYINGKLYNRLYRTYSDVAVIADEHGGDDFKKSFKAYINKNHKPDLFYRSSFSQVNSCDNVLVQLADFIVGTLAKIYEGKKTPALHEKYLELLSLKSLSLDEWPTKYQIYYQPDETSQDFDRFIFEYALAKAELFIEKHDKSLDEERQMQTCILRKLVFQSRWDINNSYIKAPELVNHLHSCSFENASRQAFRSKIIAKLRDEDVIIASCNKGYKIPSGYADLSDYIERVNDTVVPYLRRLKKARNSYRQASSGEIDLLKGIKFPLLVKLLEQIEED